MIQLRETELFSIPLRARMPFRYGIVTMTEVTHVIMRLTFAIDGQVHEGLAADHLPPKWFTKDPNRPLDEEVEEMLTVIRAAVASARAIHATTPFQFWQELYAAQGKWGVTHKIPPLLAHFGTSLVERALIDAFCRSIGVPFAVALRENRLGVDLGAMHAPLTGTAPRDWLPPQTLQEPNHHGAGDPRHVVFARHTVGLLDPIEENEIADDERVNDGLPQSLAACVKFYGLRHFKIKIDADVARARERLLRIAALLRRECGGDYAFSLDGNESFREPAVFAAQMRALLAEPALKDFWPKLLFIEQPLHRRRARVVAQVPQLVGLAGAPADHHRRVRRRAWQPACGLGAGLHRDQPQKLQRHLQGRGERMPACAAACRRNASDVKRRGPDQRRSGSLTAGLGGAGGARCDERRTQRAPLLCGSLTISAGDSRAHARASFRPLHPQCCRLAAAQRAGRPTYARVDVASPFRLRAGSEPQWPNAGEVEGWRVTQGRGPAMPFLERRFRTQQDCHPPQ